MEMAEWNLAQNGPLPPGGRLFRATFDNPTLNPNVMSWMFEDAYEYRDEALAVLEKVKAERRKMKLKVVRVGENTWVEKSVNPIKKKQPIMQHVTRLEAENAVAVYRTAKSVKVQLENQMAEAQRTVEAFGRERLDQFADGRLELDSGTVALRAGAARPVKSGKPLSTAARAELAALLPPAYVRLACDFTELFGCDDKMVRQVLNVQGVEVVRDDKYVIL